MIKVLLTGSSGFIGSHLIPCLADKNYCLYPCEGRGAGDVGTKATWDAFPSRDVVIHLAAKVFVPDSWEDPGAFFRTNLVGTVEALQYCRRHGARLIYVSSYLYGTPATNPIPETTPLVATNPYALSKKMAEEACFFFSQAFGIPVTILRLFNVYGPGQSEKFLIPTIIKQACSGCIRLRDLEPKRDYVFVKDVVAAIIGALQVKQGFHALNIGSGVSFSVLEVVNMIRDILKCSCPVVSAGERRKDEIMNTVADIRSAKRVIGWSPEWTLRQGLEATCRNVLSAPQGIFSSTTG